MYKGIYCYINACPLGTLKTKAYSYNRVLCSVRKELPGSSLCQCRCADVPGQEDRGADPAWCALSRVNEAGVFMSLSTHEDVGQRSRKLLTVQAGVREASPVHFI